MVVTVAPGHGAGPVPWEVADTTPRGTALAVTVGEVEMVGVAVRPVPVDPPVPVAGCIWECVSRT